MTQTQINFELASRDSALTRVLTNAGPDWREQVDAVVAALAVGTLVTSEDIRLACAERGIVPHVANAWGGIVNRLIRSGVLEPTGQRVAMRAPGSHARKTDVYRRT